jgi:flagellar hook protein FlgE
MGAIPSTANSYAPRIEIPLNGMRNASQRANQAAIRIGEGDINANDFVELLGARYSFEANAKVLKTMDETLGTLLNTVA